MISSPGGNIVLADNGPMFKEMYAKCSFAHKNCNILIMLTAELKAAGQSCKIAYVPNRANLYNHHPVLFHACSYIDPSYMVRSVAADTKDSHLCYLLASQVVQLHFSELCFGFLKRVLQVVHGAMHGFTQFRCEDGVVTALAVVTCVHSDAHASVCLVNNRTVCACPPSHPSPHTSRITTRLFPYCVTV
jgi:hypothetical protein